MSNDFAATCEYARTWAEHDVSETDKETVLQLVAAAEAAGAESQAAAQLHAHMSVPLTFGTAGLRAEIGAGASLMNRATVIRATKGLIDWLCQQVEQPVVVIGCDARFGSVDFARDAAAVVAANGGRALLLDLGNPTPVTAFAVRHLNADAGIMVTASHNPPADNGYKVYLGGRVVNDSGQGAQLVSPADQEIHAAIVDAPLADQIDRDYHSVQSVSVIDDYLARAAVVGDWFEVPAEQKRDTTIVLTPMHGVGGRVGVSALINAGFTNLHLVAEQAYPDPHFPTVAFPNPEEKGALDLAIARAQAVDADVIIAYDPDADRCAAVVKDPHADSGYTQLTGDELGVVLGAALVERSEHGGVANSLVSSQLLGRVAAAHGRDHAETLTGFKWISRTPGIIFGYEEAIGYCVDPDYVRDKDGITAGLVVAQLVAQLKEKGVTLLERVEEIRRSYGYLVTAPLTFRVEDTDIIARAMAAIIAQPPSELAGEAVIRSVDLSTGLGDLPPTTGLLLETARDRVIVRPSGTEPKLKCYLETEVTVTGQTTGTSSLRVDAQKRIHQVKTALQAALGL